MLLGQSILAPTSKATYHSPWMPRQGDSCTVVFQFYRASGTLTSFTCLVQTKDLEDVDPAAGVGVGSAFNINQSATPTQVIRTGFKELVRYEIVAQGSGSIQWVHYRANAPIWSPN